MQDLHVRQPNLHARLHRASPPQFRRRVAEVLSSGSVNPAVHNDEVIVPNLVERGVPLAQARDYAIVGCVEPVVAGSSFMSTDAALVNVPSALEEALGCAGRWNRKQREAAASSQNIDALYARFESALDALLQRMLGPLQMIERGNAQYHPTPLTSLLTAGTFESGRDVTAGGARWNGSGIQGVGVVDVGDAFAAIEQVVFTEQAASLPELLQACHKNFVGHEALRARLRRASKYGNGDARADAWVGRVIQSFASILGSASNSRGGSYIAGFYSMTCHQAFGEVVGALPNGRVRGEPFASGISPQSGMERAGPTAALLSQAALPLSCASNGVNFNMKLAPWIVRGEAGIARLQALLDGALAAGCMQMQFNVIDPALLIEARDNPGKYPGLLVRVSGYSAYFDDLSPAMKQEIIDRTVME
jgi:formate C-acetyltransferase